MSIDPYAGETGYYNVQGQTGSSPDLTVRIGSVYTFDQTDVSNWYHPVGFAFYPDGAHGADWGGEGRAEVEGPYLSYQINGAATTCPDAGDTGLDCYEPEFFYPRAVWSETSYTAELNVTQELAEASCGGVVYYWRGGAAGSANPERRRRRSGALPMLARWWVVGRVVA